MHVFFDTNIFIHFKPITKEDLCSLTDTADSYLVIPLTTVRELEKRKSSLKKRRVRDRAIATLNHLKSALDSGCHEYNNIPILFFAEYPRAELDSLHLDDNWGDDVLVASVKRFITQNPDADVRLITDDTGLQIAATLHNINCITLPSSYQLQPELDEQEKELIKVRSELAQLKDAQPKLSVVFSNFGNNRYHAKIQLSEITFEESRYNKLCDKAIKDIPRMNGGSDDRNGYKDLERNYISRINGITETAIDEYNKARQKYIADTSEYWTRIFDHENLQKRSFVFDVQIENSGKAPADDIDLELTFPSGVHVWDSTDPPKLPRKPIPPEKPSMFGAASYGNLSMPRTVDYSEIRSLSICTAPYPVVTDHIDCVKHGVKFPLTNLVVAFENESDIGSFTCSYRMNVGNIPNAIAGDLHVIVDHG